jgi:adenosylcobinamide-phosphate synthase
VSVQSVAPLALAVAFDLALGEPPPVIHPVIWMGRAIALCERVAWSRSSVAQLLAGGAMALGVPALFASTAWLLMTALRPHPLLAMFAGAILLKTTFALRALGRAARRVRDAVAQGRIEDARQGLRSLCSRDPSTLEAPELVAATIESVAENTSDSFVAPLFWFALFGLPGAMFYRAVNTLDAMVGYHGRYEWLGKPAARLDDLMNLVPARLTAWLLIAGGALAGFDARRASRVLARDGARTESPNAGRPMAAMAGLLGVELSKPGHYRLGDALEPLDARQIDRASAVALIASALAAVIATLILEGTSCVTGA